jgi:hypothetical protein
MLFKGILEGHPENFSATVCLDALDRKGKCVNQAMLKKVDRIAGGALGYTGPARLGVCNHR